jgi:CheY-like chemotaxis protein
MWVVQPTGLTDQAYVALILIVEGDPDQRRIYTELLYYNGFDVVGAASAFEMIAAINNQRPDLILMDIHLADSDGAELTHFLKSSPSTAKIPVVAFSGYPVAEARALLAGAVAFLKKPVAADLLVRTLTNNLEAGPPIN